MNKYLFFLAILSTLTFNSYANGLQTRLTPGGIYVGAVNQEERIFYQGREVMVGHRGQFVIGFGRDASLQQSYRVVDRQGSERVVNLVLAPRQYPIETITGIARKFVTPPEPVLARIRQESAQVKVARVSETRQYDLFDGFGWPVRGRISGVYGSQRVYNGKPGRPHFGLDIAVPTGTPVTAPASGIVTLADDDLYYSGGTIIIDHGFGISSSFLHLSKVTVAPGDEIMRGDIIGAVGTTGRSTGPHLDWRYNWFDKRLDPQLLTVSQQ